MIKEDRSLGMYILLSICTCGIYSWYFIYTMAQDSNTMCQEDGKKTPGLLAFILLTIITCGFYGIYWEYSLANRLAGNAPRYGMNFQENGTTVLLWHLFGALLCGVGPFIAINILIKNMNALAHAYNQGNPQQGYGFSGQQPGQNYLTSNGDDYTMPVEEWKPDQSQIPQGGSMECCRGAYEGTIIPIDGEVIIGRDETCSHIVIKGAEISRKHCGISYDPQTGSYIVTDYSSNGVYYKNGQRFPQNQPVACNAGTIIVIAESGNEFLLK